MENKTLSNLLYKVYYTDGSIFVGTKDNVGDTPIWEVLVIVQMDRNHGKRIITNGDFYVYESGSWLACDQWTMMQYMARKGMEKRFLVGVMVDGELWNSTVKKAREDGDFPVQTAYYAGEAKAGD